MRINRIVTLLICFMLLTGCMDNSKLKEETNIAKEMEQSNKEMENTLNKLEDIESPIYVDENTILPNELSQDNLDMADKNKMAAYYGMIQNDFITGHITAKGYADFLKSYASKSSPILRDETNLEETLKNVQLLYQEREARILKYRLSEVTLDDNSKYATFYKESQTDILGNEFFLTTMELEDGKWKFYSDEPTSPVIIGGNNEN